MGMVISGSGTESRLASCGEPCAMVATSSAGPPTTRKKIPSRYMLKAPKLRQQATRLKNIALGADKPRQPTSMAANQ